MASPLFAKVTTAESCGTLFPLTIEACKQSVDLAKRRADDVLQLIYAFSSTDRKFTNIAKKVDIAQAELMISGGLLAVVSQVSTEESVRNEAAQQMVQIEQLIIEKFATNRQLFQALKDVQSNDPPKDPQQVYWLEQELDNYRRKGLDLPDEQFEKVKKIEMDLSALASQFQQNIAADKTQLEFSEDELTGTPATVIGTLSKTDKGNFIVKMDYPTVFGILNNCEVPATREKVSIAFGNRAYPINEPILHEAIKKRHELSQCLNYPSYAHLNLADKMARTPEVAKKFVEDLVPKVQTKWEKELELIKQNLPASCKLTADGLIESYDVMFIINQLKKSLLNVDETAIQEYFPMEETVKGLFYIYQLFFNISLVEVQNGPNLWHKDVSMLEVKDKASGSLLGYIILDLFPRDGKFTHACCHSVVPPALCAGGSFSPALGVVVANFPVATADRPALFTHSDVQTFFHEFGHALHGLLGRTKMASAAGTNVKLDFVELPSQMLEEWLWEPEILQKITKHYKTGQPLPQELIDAKVKSKNAFSGRDNLRQLQFATLSLDIFGLPFSATSGDLNTKELFSEIESRVMPGVRYSDATHMECSFGHLMGYDAGYYGYMWSKVFAIDVFNFIRSKNGLLDPAMGQKYASSILGVGGSRDPNISLKEFLGREPDNEAFLSNIGL